MQLRTQLTSTDKHLPVLKPTCTGVILPMRICECVHGMQGGRAGCGERR